MVFFKILNWRIVTFWGLVFSSSVSFLCDQNLIADIFIIFYNIVALTNKNISPHMIMKFRILQVCLFSKHFGLVYLKFRFRDILKLTVNFYTKNWPKFFQHLFSPENNLFMIFCQEQRQNFSHYKHTKNGVFFIFS